MCACLWVDVSLCLCLYALRVRLCDCIVPKTNVRTSHAFTCCATKKILKEGREKGQLARRTYYMYFFQNMCACVCRVLCVSEFSYALSEFYFKTQSVFVRMGMTKCVSE